MEAATAQLDVIPTGAMPAQEITADEVFETWSSVSDLAPAGANRLQKRTVEAQPDLAAFTLAFTEDLRDEARSVAVFVFHCISEVFRKHAGRTRRVNEKTLTRQWPRSVERVAVLAREIAAGGSDDAYVDTGPQPALLDAVLEALSEVQEGDDAIDLSGEEYWQLLTVLDAIVVALHEQSTPRRAV